ncbi:hemolysin-III related-domain-containing protein [Mrakia frigida]|uniref:hemolysin III family protein n=1 Tax=Mrakia frigida TaxID=29902 RepID=UPI003FCC0C9A
MGPKPFPPISLTTDSSSASLRQRSTPNGSPSPSPSTPLLAQNGDSKTPPADKGSKSHPLLTFEELPEWMKEFESEFTLVGYRRQQNSYWSSWWSAVGYLHNETVNIHTHLLAAFIPLTLLLLHHLPMVASLPSLRWQDTFHFSVFLASAVVCLAFSGTYHTLSCHSKSVANRWNQMDYVGIVTLIVGSNYPAIYYGFYCDLKLQWIYITVISILGSMATYVVLHPTYTTGPYRWARTSIFLSLGCSAVIPVTHNLLRYGWERARTEMGLSWLLASGGLYIFGALLYAIRFPERTFPRTFDIFGSSHQIFRASILAPGFPSPFPLLCSLKLTLPLPLSPGTLLVRYLCCSGSVHALPMRHNRDGVPPWCYGRGMSCYCHLESRSISQLGGRAGLFPSRLDFLFRFAPSVLLFRSRC